MKDSFLDKVENLLRSICGHILYFIMQYTIISILFSIITLTLIFGLSDCALTSYDHNDVSKSEVQIIVDNLDCAWNNKFSICICVYNKNYGAIGMNVPDRMCGK